ncbi:MAG TPA: ATP-binding protein [Oculatellaceae cyanobacterium]
MTERYVIIGGPSSGKTTVVEKLAELGYATVAESARLILEEMRLADPRPVRDAFQCEVFRRQLDAEARILDGVKTSFLDGGIFDGCAYYLNDGLDVPSMFDTVDGSRYSQAFLFEPLDVFVQDGIRYQNAESSRHVAELLFQCYEARGIAVERVPNASIEERVHAILNRVNSVRLNP